MFNNSLCHLLTAVVVVFEPAIIVVANVFLWLISKRIP